MLIKTDRLLDIVAEYDVILSDVWGVVHNGVKAHPKACAALAEARAAGKIVVLITNSPRTWPRVASQMAGLGVPEGTYDRIVTSGDVTRRLIEEGPERIFFIGDEHNRELFHGLGVHDVPEDEAEAILCTGPFNDDVEGPEDYRELLTRLRARNLPFICANPDLMVERGDRLVYCAGALAKLYAELGGETRIAGKPYTPIYDAAMAEAAELHDGAIDTARVLAVGDGLLTDVKGAQDFGLDVLYIGGGIHAGHYSGGGAIDAERLEAYLASEGARPRFWMQHLV